jgi:pimeloyl-ACP methyl ester carboxylesterase
MIRKGTHFTALSVLFLLLCTLLAPAGLAQDPSPALAGTWFGRLAVGGIELRLGLNIEQAEDGSVSGTMDSIDQGAMGIAIDSMTLEGNTFRFTISSSAFSYEGTLGAGGDEITGTWSQRGVSLPLAFARTDEAPELSRPQEPEPPYPYHEEEVAFVNHAVAEGEDQVTLAGTFTRPKESGPHPAVVLVTGSGPQDRNETVLGHRPFLILADYLTRRSVAVLRYDDRGMGGSTGSFAAATSEDFAGDARAAIEYLRTRQDVDGERIGILGHSEGGLIAPMVAADSDHVAFVVMIAGSGVSGRDIILRQTELIMRTAGASDESIRATRETQTRMYETIAEEPDPEKAFEAVRELVAARLAELSEDERKALGGSDPEQLSEMQASQVTSDWFRFLLDFDPRSALTRLKCPVLAVNGEKDLQVDPAQNLPPVLEALIEAPTTDFTAVQLPSLNHLLQTAETGAVTEYGQIEETMAPIAQRTIGDWFVARPRGAG